MRYWVGENAKPVLIEVKDHIKLGPTGLVGKRAQPSTLRILFSPNTFAGERNSTLAIGEGQLLREAPKDLSCLKEKEFVWGSLCTQALRLVYIHIPYTLGWFQGSM